MSLPSTALSLISFRPLAKPSNYLNVIFKRFNHQRNPIKYDITEPFRSTVQLLEKNPLAWVVGKDQGEFIFRLPTSQVKNNNNGTTNISEGFDFISLNIHPEGKITSSFQESLSTPLESSSEEESFSYTLIKHELIPKTKTDSSPKYKKTPLIYSKPIRSSHELVNTFTTQFQFTNPPSDPSNAQYYSQSAYRTSLPNQIQFLLARNIIQTTLTQSNEINERENIQVDFRKNINFVTHLFTPEPCNQGLFDDLIFSITRASGDVPNQLEIMDRWCKLIMDSEKVMKKKIGEIKGRGIKFDEELQYWGNVVEDKEILGKVIISRD